MRSCMYENVRAIRSSMPSTSKVRSKQQERSAETRQLLLDATIQTLVEKGYGATTIAEICSRAGFTRGAQLHHFETREQLVLRAVEHLFEARLQQFATVFERLSKSARTDRTVIDLIWPVFESSFFLAWLEILIASRTDGELRKKVRETDQRLDQALIRFCGRFSGADEQRVKLFLSVLISFMTGMVIVSRFGDSARILNVSAASLLGVLKEFLTFLQANPRILRK